MKKIKKPSIACIGQGFVGGSLTTVMSEKGFDVYAYDKAGKYAPGGKCFDVKSIRDFALTCEQTIDVGIVYFVCVPTPMFEDGSCDTSIVESVLEELDSIPGQYPRVVVVKSTVPPGSTERWNLVYSGLNVVHCPEFLTEANALNDMRNQDRIILGGSSDATNIVKKLFRTAFPNVTIIKTTSTTSEMVKYFTNVQLAARVVLSCELAEVCDALNMNGHRVEYDDVREFASLDRRLGGSHMFVPGPSGIPGARGHCFPKDIAALISCAKSIGVDPKIMNAVKEKNLDIVPSEHRDWEKMEGRAVTKNEILLNKSDNSK